MQAAGWLSAKGPRPSTALRWSDPARPRVQAAFSDQHPDLARRLNEAAADWNATHGSPERALRYAVAALSWSRVVLLVESHWPALLYRYPGTLTRALQATPPAIVAMSALVSALTELLPVQPPGEMVLPPLLSETELASVMRSPLARSALEASLAAMVVLRRRGSFAYAHAYSRQLAAIQLADPSVLSPQTAGIASLALTQSAILAELSGDSDEAIGTLREAFRWVPASLFTFSESEIAARLAVSYSRLGLLRQATDWLDHLRQLHPRGQRPARPRHSRPRAARRGDDGDRSPRRRARSGCVVGVGRRARYRRVLAIRRRGAGRITRSRGAPNRTSSQRSRRSSSGAPISMPMTRAWLVHCSPWPRSIC